MEQDMMVSNGLGSIALRRDDDYRIRIMRSESSFYALYCSLHLHFQRFLSAVFLVFWQFYILQNNYRHFRINGHPVTVERRRSWEEREISMGNIF